MPEYQNGQGQQGRIGTQLGFGRPGHLVTEQLPLCIQTFELCSQNACPDRVGSGQQFHGWVGVPEPPQGVETWTQDEADMLLGQICRHKFRHFHDRL